MSTLNEKALNVVAELKASLLEALESVEALERATGNGRRNKANERRLRMQTLALNKKGLEFRKASVE